MSQANDRWLRWPQVHEIIPIGRTTAWRWEKEGRFPRRRQISPGITVWSEREIREFAEAINGREAA